MREAGQDESNPFGYAAAVWERFRAPRRAGTFSAGAAGVVSGQAGSPAARSILQLQFQVQDGRVADARFRAYGCPTSIAVGSWIADWSVGRGRNELKELELAQMRAALEISDDRAHCALLGEDALRAALAHWTP